MIADQWSLIHEDFYMPGEKTVSPTARADKEKQNAAASSVAAAVLLTTLKLGVGLATNSLGVLSEAAHSALDLMAAGMRFIAVKVASVLADKGHPYGHGKIENLSALIEALLLLITCGWITWEAVDRLFFNPVLVKPSFWAVLVMLLSIIVDHSRARMLMRVAKEHRSQALEADALHFSTDMLSSAVVIAGLGALYVAEALPETSALRPWLERADALAALGVSAIVLKVSWSLGKRAVNVLLDAGDTALAQDVRASLSGLAGVRHVENVRIRHSGPDMLVDIELAAEGSLVLDEAEYLRREVAKRVTEKAEHANVAVVIVSHGVDKGDRIANLRGLAAAHGLVVHAVDVLELETPSASPQDGVANHALVEMHVEFPPETPLDEAFLQVSLFEREFIKERPGVVMVSHIEPAGTMSREKVESFIESREVMAAVSRIVTEEPGIRDAHNILVRSFGNGRRVSFHCAMDHDASVAAAHAIASRVQEKIRKEVPELDRVTVQVEPCRTGTCRQTEALPQSHGA